MGLVLWLVLLFVGVPLVVCLVVAALLTRPFQARKSSRPPRD